MNLIARMMKRYIKTPLKYALPLLFIGALVLVSTTGCITTTTNTSSSNSNVKDVSSGLVISAKAVSPSPQSNGNGLTPQSGNVFVVYNCTVKNTGANGIDIDASNWHLRGPNGYYDGQSVSPVVAPDFSHIDQSKVGDVASGYVYFEVPSNASVGPWTSLRFTNSGLSGILSNETFDLSVNV
jgi:archaellin